MTRLSIEHFGVALMLALVGCTDKDVVARAGKVEIRRGDLSGPGIPVAADAKSRVESLIPRALLAEGARRAGLHADPVIQTRIRAAEREILAQAYLEKELAAASDESALRKRYEEKKESLKRRGIHVRHIVIRRGESAEADLAAQSRATGIYAELAGGADFEALARERSEDPVTAPKGGELGTLLEGQVDAAFFSAGAALSKGQVTRPFATSSGHHLVKAVEDPLLIHPSFDEIRGRLAGDARREARAELLERLRKEIPVVIFEDRLLSEPPKDERKPRETP